jgi:signal transduction histidine kinase
MNNENPTATIMVVDDTPANLKLLEGMLRGLGYRVLEFPHGAMALKAAARNPPDLILLDIILPGMDGFEVCRRLKADESLKDIPVLFISALDGTDDKIKGFAAGGLDYVTKPFQEEEVLARVKTHLELRRQQLRIEVQNRQLQESHDRLRQLEELRDNLVHLIVHDMRSPLMVISGACEMIGLEKGRLSPPQQQFAIMGQNSCRQLIEMVSSLLDISRLETEQMPLKRVVCDLRDIAAASAESVAILAQKKKLTIQVNGEPSHASVDRDIMHRVLINLLGNAIKFSPEGGSIGVTISSTEDTVRAAVTDQGDGIPPEYHQRIFEKFGQVESRKEGKRLSTGLGLTFCKLAVEAHGGQIGVDSEPGKGSTFWLSLGKNGSER